MPQNPQPPLGDRLRSRTSAIDQLVDEIQGRTRPPAPPMPSPQAAVANPPMSPEAMAILAALAGQADPADTRDERYPLTPALAERRNPPSLRALDQAVGGRR
jgi:hypothetical protein